MRPGLGNDETDFGCDVVHLVSLGGEMNIVGKENATAIAMELQFLDAFGESTEVVEQSIFHFPGETQEMKAVIDHHAIDDRANNTEDAENREHLPGQPTQVNGAAEENCNVDRHHRYAQQRLGDVQYIFSERDHKPRRADLFESTKWHI